MIATRSTAERVAELHGLGIDAVQLALGPGLAFSGLEALAQAETAVILLPPGTRKGSGHEFPEKISRLISGLKKAGIHRVVFASSTAVYPSRNREVDETEIAPPDTQAGRILFEAEKHILKDPGIQGIVVRFAGLCGPGREVGRLLAGRTDLPGGDSPVNLIHQRDAVGLLMTVIEHRPWGQIFNGCAPGHPAKSDLYPDAAKALGLTPPVFSHASAPFKKVSGDKISRQLGFIYRYPDPSAW